MWGKNWSIVLPEKDSSTTSWPVANHDTFLSRVAALLITGTLKRVGDIKRGDCVSTSTSSNAASTHGIVLCVVKTACHAGRTALVELPNAGTITTGSSTGSSSSSSSSSLLVTPWHPVRHACVVAGELLSSWAFPSDLADAGCGVGHPTRACDFVYSFVLADDAGEIAEALLQSEPTGGRQTSRSSFSSSSAGVSGNPPDVEHKMVIGGWECVALVCLVACLFVRFVYLLACLSVCLSVTTPRTHCDGHSV